MLAYFFKLKKSTCKTTIAKKNPLKLLPVATRQTFTCKYTFLADFNASLWLFSSVNHETIFKIYLAKINHIFPASNCLLTKILQKCFQNLSSTHIIIKRKWHKFFNREVLIADGCFHGCFRRRVLN